MKLPEIYKNYHTSQDEANSAILKLKRNGFTILSKRTFRDMGRVVMSYVKFED